jgi:1-acyl-sn-glycerol-3-phosphate acyltransferase
VFPEGTTTDGATLLKFHASLLQPIVEAQGHVVPVAIRYRGGDGAHSTVPAYVGDESFATSFWRVCGARRLVVELRTADALPARGANRRDLARAAEESIRTALGLPGAGTAPGRSGGPGA